MAAKVRSKAELDSEKCKQLALNFSQEQKKFKQAQLKFTEVKERFYSDMEDYFKSNNSTDGKLRIVGDAPDSEALVIKRIQSSKVEFDLVKLEKALGKQLSHEVIIKHYEISDMNGLNEYLKECGVDPKIFKSFLSISRSLNVVALDRLADLGKITQEQIEGCYTVKKQNPYFTVSVERGQSDEDRN